MAAASDFADNSSSTRPGLGLEVEGRDTVTKHVSEFVQQADIQYDVEQVVEHGPFVVAFARSTGTLDGQRMTWDLCEVLRYEGDRPRDKFWALRGGPPTATSA